MSTDIATRQDTASALVVPIGLALSIGEPGQPNRPGRQIEYFRPKEGQLGQYADAAEKFAEVYGMEPRRLTDVYFIADTPEAVFDVRLLAFSKSGLRLRGHTNYAQFGDPDEFQARAYAFDDDVTYYPRTVAEVKPELREGWQGEPISGKLTGRDDPRIAKLDIRLVASLSFLLPEVLGVGMRVVLTTGGRRSTRNLHAGVWSQYLAFHGLLGRPFRLTVRPARTQRFDKEQRKYVETKFQELVLDTPQTVMEILDEIDRRRATLGTGPDRLALPAAEAVTEAESQILGDALDLPPVVDVRVFDEEIEEGEIVPEPEAEVEASDEESGALFQEPPAEVHENARRNRAKETGEA